MLGMSPQQISRYMVTSHGKEVQKQKMERPVYIEWNSDYNRNIYGDENIYFLNIIVFKNFNKFLVSYKILLKTRQRENFHKHHSFQL